MDIETDRARHGSDLNVRAIVLVALALAALGGSVQLVLWFQLKGMWAQRQAEAPPPSPVAQALPEAPPAPRLQTSPLEDLKALRAAEAERLGSYGWVDRKAGVVRIPIERAMELVAGEQK
jgi:hypothetical protein